VADVIFLADRSTSEPVHVREFTYYDDEG